MNREQLKKLEKDLWTAADIQPQIELLELAQPATLTVVCEGKTSASRAEFGVAVAGDEFIVNNSVTMTGGRGGHRAATPHASTIH